MNNNLKLFKDKIEDTCRHGDWDEVSYKACFEHMLKRLKLNEALLNLEQKEKAKVCFDEKNIEKYSKYCEKQGGLKVFKIIKKYHSPKSLGFECYYKIKKLLEDSE